MAQPRQAAVALDYKGAKFNAAVSDYLTNYSYTDIASGASDSISIGLHNIDEKWLSGWFPIKGDSLKAQIAMANWEREGQVKVLKCGDFTIDDVSFSGPNLTCNIKAVSMPTNADFKSTNKSKTWTNVTIKEIASQIAKEAGIELYYEAMSIRIAEIEQSFTPNSSFLLSVCEKYGLSMKIFNNKLVIFEEGNYATKDSVATIKADEMLSWSYNSTIDGTYTGAALSYTDPDSDETITVQVGSSERLYIINSQADSKYDAELQAMAKVNSANKKMVTMEIKIVANTAIIASSVVTIEGLGKLNGRYYVDSVKHAVGSGYTMTLTLHQIQNYIKPSSVVEVEADSGNTNYIVKSGDTLWGLAKTYYGSGIKYVKIYEANKNVIEATAKEQGFVDSNNGYWIFPGTELIIPA